MFGKVIERYCPNCEGGFKTRVLVGFNIDGKNYYDSCICPKCNEDVSKEDRKIIRKAKKEGKDFSVIMY